jgi:dihydrofolate reductase
MLNLIAAHDRHRAIGRQNALPWHIPADLQHFKALTLNQTVLMGRKTFASIGKALPKRRNLVLSRDINFLAPGVERIGSLEAAMKMSAAEPLWVIGGAEIYALALPYAHTLEITEIDTVVHDADTFFPRYDDRFEQIESSAWQAHEPQFRFTRWQRSASADRAST